MYLDKVLTICRPIVAWLRRSAELIRTATPEQKLQTFSLQVALAISKEVIRYRELVPLFVSDQGADCPLLDVLIPFAPLWTTDGRCTRVLHFVRAS